MAIITSHQFSTIRGSIDDTTYYAGPGHPILARARVIPANPSTQYRTWARSIPATFWYWWNYYEDAIREGWASWAATLPPPNDVWPHRFYGHHAAYGSLFIRRYNNLFGLPAMTIWGRSIPTRPGWLEHQCRHFKSISATSIRLRVRNTSLDHAYLFGWLSAPLPHTRNYFTGPYDPTSLKRTSSLNPGATGTLIWTGLQTDKRYFVKYIGIAWSSEGARYYRPSHCPPVDL